MGERCIAIGQMQVKNKATNKQTSKNPPVCWTWLGVRKFACLKLKILKMSILCHWVLNFRELIFQNLSLFRMIDFEKEKGCVWGVVCELASVDMCICICRDKGWHWVSFLNHSLLRFRDSVSHWMELEHYLDCLASDSICLCYPQCWEGVTSCAVGSGDLNPGLHVCTASTLPTEPSPSPWKTFLLCFM